MSINLENPKTLIEKIDAARNFIEQMYLAHSIHDEATFIYAHKRAGDLLFEAQLEAEGLPNDEEQ